MAYPAEELEWWCACFSINDNNDKPQIITPVNPTTIKESIEQMKRVLS